MDRASRRLAHVFRRIAVADFPVDVVERQVDTHGTSSLDQAPRKPRGQLLLASLVMRHIGRSLLEQRSHLPLGHPEALAYDGEIARHGADFSQSKPLWSSPANPIIYQDGNLSWTFADDFSMTRFNEGQ